jgi:threonine/homoserine/homoserine lactone efflux protein
MFLAFLQGFSLGFTNAVSPGPFLAYLLSQTLERGWRYALPLALAPLVSDGPIILLTLLVLSQTPDWFMRVLLIIGGLLLLYLAKGAFELFLKPKEITATGAAANTNFFKAVAMNGTSPGPYIFWGTVGGPTLRQGWLESPGLPVSFLAGFYLTLLGGLMGYIILFAVASRIDPRLTRALNLVSAIALLLFGLYRLWQGIFP